MRLTSPQVNNIELASGKALENLTALSNSASNQFLEGEDQRDSEVALKYRNEIERLSIWFDEHGIRAGKLDHKLREASQLRDRVLSLLAELSGNVNA